MQLARIARFGWLKSKRELIAEAYASQSHQGDERPPQASPPSATPNASRQIHALRRHVGDPLSLDILLPATHPRIHYVVPGLFTQRHNGKSGLHAGRMRAFADQCVFDGL